MSVKSEDKDNNELILTLDNGDREKFKQALQKWNFKDEESLLRFVVSLLIESKDSKSIGIYTQESPAELKTYKPANHLLKHANEEDAK